MYRAWVRNKFRILNGSKYYGRKVLWEYLDVVVAGKRNFVYSSFGWVVVNRDIL